MRHRNERRAGLWIAVVVAGASLGVPVALAAPDDDLRTAEPAREQLRHAISLSEAFKAVVRQTVPAVVHITSVRHVDPSDEETRRRVWPFRNSDADEMIEVPVGQGTGVIIRSDGYVVTNNHVIRRADEVRLRLQDGRQFDAEVVGADADTDIAVLRIEADELPAVPFGDSEQVEPGEWVLAIGSPFGLSHSVTSGIVSAIGRRDMGLATYENFIQTDATINPGNSGGPLVNLYGEMIGINTAISTRTGSSQGIGFAIPSSMVHDVVDAILDQGRVVRGWLGVRVMPLTEDVAQRVGYEGDGVVIVPVSDGVSPASEAGLESGDVVTTINGQPVRDRNSLMELVAAIPPGDTALLGVVRDGDELSYEVVVGERPVQTGRR
jgi:Do/DeqQ family serine protease